jgi:hypothetical protein
MAMLEWASAAIWFDWPDGEGGDEFVESSENARTARRHTGLPKEHLLHYGINNHFLVLGFRAGVDPSPSRRMQ